MQARKKTQLTLKRRKVFSLCGGAIAVSTIEVLRRSFPVLASTPTHKTLTQLMPACVVKPQQTAGPYFVDERLNRQDIRSNPNETVLKSGVPLRVRFQVSQMQGTSCTPIKGAIVDIWHCDATGVYSDVRDPSFNTIGQKFLRGYQTTDANGIAEFITIYPGAYSGRTVHIHFKIRTGAIDAPSYEFTSQVYFEDATTDQVLAQSAYRVKGDRTRNAQDGIFRSGGDRLILPVAKRDNGYEGTFNIGLELG